jgi:mono/diheme cytochrome c family protein
MRGFAILLLLTTALPLCAQAQAPDSTGAVLARGKRLFEGRGLCFSCHGKAGEGVLGPTTALAEGKWIHTKGERANIIALIKTGVDATQSKSGIVMPPRGGSRLSDAEVEAVASYVITLAKPSKP